MASTFRAALIIGVLCTACLASVAAAQSPAIALRGVTLVPVDGPPIPDGLLLFENGRIVAIGAAASVPLPDGTRVRDLSGRVVIPGLVDTHSHVGLLGRPVSEATADGNEGTAPVTPEMRAFDAIWPADPGIRMAQAGGITTANIMPGSGNVVGGQTAYVKLRGDTIEAMAIRGADGQPLGGMKMAAGENPKRSHGSKNRSPSTRMAVAFLERKLFVDARAHREALARSEHERAEHARKVEAGEDAGTAPVPPARDLRLDPMLEVLDGSRIVHHHVHRADDIATVLRIRDEFGHRVVLQHATEAALVADLIASSNVPVSTLILDAPGGKHEAVALLPDTPGKLERAGVKVALHTDDYITSSRLLLRMGAQAVRGGMSEDGALRGLTQNAAEMLDLGERVGSLSVGKDADFVVLSGPPFATGTRVLETWIEGERVFDAADPADRRYQTGGFALGDRYPALPGAAP